MELSKDKSLVKLLTTGGLTGLVAIILMMTAFKIKKNNLTFTCNKYILNTYLYVFLSFLIIAVSLVSAEHNKLKYVVERVFEQESSYLLWTTIRCGLFNF